ncbi:MAG: hypothetical protein NT003_01565 [Candidatus Magasanikbacteria bacterium]|nr:hypothetical protein [Candidatus Magasanikbacteria bacterium]
MTFRAAKIIQRLSIYFIATSFVVSLFAPHAQVQAESCCSYQPDTAAKSTPSWIKDLGKGAFYQQPMTGSSCPSPTDPSLAIAPFGPYYETDPRQFESSCSDAGTYSSQIKLALNGVQCCILTDQDDKKVACVDKKASDVSSSCLALLKGKSTGTSKIYASQLPCSGVVTCTGTSTAVPASPTAGSTATKPWTQQECESIKLGSGAAYTWIPPANDPGVTSGDYCFVKPWQQALEVSIGNTVSVKGVAIYLNVMYKYALGLGVLVMTISIIVAGIQWMVSGVVDTIHDAQHRIQNGVIGLLLLLGANTLLYTINPQLTELKTPPIHAIRPEVISDKKVGCDPTVPADTCLAKDPTTHCVPNYDGIKKACGNQMMILAAAVAAPAAIGAGFGAAGGAIVATQAAIALDGIGAYATQALVGTVIPTAINLTTTKIKLWAVDKIADTLVPQFYTSLKIATAVGVGYGAYQIATSGGEAPPLGSCEAFVHDKGDGAICSFDNECQSSKCLITSTKACGSLKYGICVSGKLREPCKQDDAKFACTQGSCVLNGKGVETFTNSVGFCSDGSNMGMPCGSGKAPDGDITCKGIPGKPMECIDGYCRDEGYYNADGTIKQYDFELGKPKCVLPIECAPIDNDAIASAQGAAGAVFTGCLKGPDTTNGLPARMLVSGGGATITNDYFLELSTVGVCTIQSQSIVHNVNGKDVPAPCYVNAKALDNSNTSIAISKLNEYLGEITSPSSLPPSFSKGLDLEAIGCQFDSCAIHLTDFTKEKLVFGSLGIASVKGECRTEPKIVSWSNQPVEPGVNIIQIGSHPALPYTWLGADNAKNPSDSKPDNFLIYVEGHTQEGFSNLQVPSFKNIGQSFLGGG